MQLNGGMLAETGVCVKSNDLRKAKVCPSQQTTVEGHYTFGSDDVLLYPVLIFTDNTEG